MEREGPEMEIGGAAVEIGGAAVEIGGPVVEIGGPVVEIGGLEPSPPHDGLLERIQDTTVQTPLPSVGAALRAIALGLSQLADALDPIPSPPDPS